MRRLKQKNQPRKLWRSLATMMGSKNSDETIVNMSICTTVARFFFHENVATVRRATNGNTVLSSLESTAVLDEFATCSIADIQKTIMEAPSKSCSLDPLPTSVLKYILPEIMSFIADMCNASLQDGRLPVSQRYAVITPRLKKDNADTADAKNYRPISNLIFISKVVDRLVCHQLIAFLDANGLLPKL